MCYKPDRVPNRDLEEKIKTHTERIRKAEKLNASNVEFPVIRDPSTPQIVKIFMYNCHEDGNEGYCKTVYFNKKQVRLIDFGSDSSGVITVAGYLKGYKNIYNDEYSMTEDRWETIQLLTEEERTKLEEILKNKYATINFWK